jgi:hypothetical protein
MDISYKEAYSMNREEARPHYRGGMNGKTPFQKLKELSYDLPEEFALFPPLILDTISTNWLLETGNDLLAHYKITSASSYYQQGLRHALVPHLYIARPEGISQIDSLTSFQKCATLRAKEHEVA